MNLTGHWDRARAAGGRLRRNLPYWVAATVTGLVAVGYARGVEWATQLASRRLTEHALLFVGLAPLSFVLARLLVIRWAPSAAGSGIPQVMAAIGAAAPSPASLVGLFGKRVLVVKILSSLVGFAGGAAIGREGPMIQIAAVIFHEIGLRYRQIRTAAEHQAWLITGGAAGLAAAFNTPLGGIVFAIEELATPHFRRFKTVLISAVIVAGVVAQLFLGPYLFLAAPPLGTMAASELPLVIVTGAVVGLCAGLFGRALTAASVLVRRLSASRSLWFAAACGLGVALLAVAGGPPVIGGGVDSVRGLLAGEPTGGPAPVAAIRAATTWLSYASGMAGGVFAPALSLGANLGAAIDSVVHSGNTPLMATAGMTAFLAGLTHAPFTSFVLAVEMTNRHEAIFPLMLAAVAGASSSSWFLPISFYSRVTRTYGAAFVPDEPRT